MKKAYFVIVGICMVAFMAASVSTQAAEPPILARLSGKEKQRVANLIKKAKKEGSLVYATNQFQRPTAMELRAKFKELYGLGKNFKVTHYLLKSAELVSRIDEEDKAGKVSMDWFMVNVPSFFRELRRRGALLEYNCPQYKYYKQINEKAMLPNVPPYYETMQVICFTGLWNPKYIKQNITSWWDFTNPKYKGKIIVADAAKAPVYLDTYIVMRQKFGKDLFEKLAKLNPFFLVRSTEIRDKVATGEFPIAFWGLNIRAYQVRKEVDIKTVFPKEGSVLEPMMGAILTGAKHPNAARLWTDFIFGKLGQSILVKDEAILTCRENMKIPPEVAKFSPPLSQIKAIPFDWSKLTEGMRNHYRQEFDQIFGR